MAAILAAHFGRSPLEIKFPIKLPIEHEGLVLGTTDDSMYKQLEEMARNKGMRRTTLAVVHATSPNTYVGPFTGAWRCFPNVKWKSSIKFNLQDPPPRLSQRCLENPQGTSSKFKYCSHLISQLTQRAGTKRLIYPCVDGMYSVDVTCQSAGKSRRIIQLDTSDPVVDVHTLEIIKSFGLKIANDAPSSVMRVAMEFDHPILQSKVQLRLDKTPSFVEMD
ncbi:hypothetical protein BdWA1_003201 [Babesia duncani]|uniref:Uncharacterized protein n=1 Tax=Babesia duncani TaxID=323732 RepID=A0AAD9PIW1_9APIC|nr:hypothetical protein BdWA1_003201 [Babesia duncani]